MLEWLKNLLFTPKRGEIVEMRGHLSALEARIQRIEGYRGIDIRENRKEERMAAMAGMEAEIKELIDKNVPPMEALKTVGLRHPLQSLQVINDLKRSFM